MFEPYRETVSIPYALIFGANGACINISAMSILSAFAAFMIGVIILQYFARKLWSRMTKVRSPADQPLDDADNCDKFKDSAVWSARK